MASPDKAQPPAAASNHANQPAAASGHIDQPAAPSAAPPVPLVEGRQAPPPRGTGSNGNQAPAASENIPREAVPTPVAVQSARVLERMGQTEMRVGMNTADFGNVELRASVSQDRVGASVTTAHLDLRAALMAEMPSLEHSMEQHQLRLDHLDLGANGGGNQERGNLAQQQQSRSQSGAEAGFTTTSSSSSDAVPSPEGPAPSSWGAPYSSGLNVHA
jgi:flagellar hook-length control protein FliK